MKLTFCLLIIALLQVGVFSKVHSQQSQNDVEFLGIYSNHILQWWPPEALAQYLGVPGYLESPYNVFLLTFWLSTGTADTALVWEKPLYFFSSENPFGKTDDEIRKNILDRFHKQGKKVLVSAFGATEFPATGGLNPNTTCDAIADFVLKYSLDGVDLDFEDNDSFSTGIAEKWLIDCTRTIRKKLPVGKYLLTHAPQGPYFIGNKTIYKNGGYIAVNEAVGDLIDFYNVQFYNQGTTKYDTYETLFQKSGGEWPNTSVGEMIKSGIDKKKIIIGKPIGGGDATNTGWISPASLGKFVKQAKTDSDINWDGGFFGWQLSSDISSNYINTYLANSK